MDPTFASTTPTGVPGFDVLFSGGLPQGRMYLVEGAPGTGKTTLALQFALEGVRRGERVLYVTLSQRTDELAEIAASHGWLLDGIDVMGAETAGLDLHKEDATLLHPDEVDLAGVMDVILTRVQETNPARVVIDSAAEVRILAGDPLRSRRRFLLLKHALGEASATTLLLDDHSSGGDDSAVHSIMHGVVRLERSAPQYGPVYRRVYIPKIRGVDNPTGFHDMRILRGGIEVYPSLTTGRRDGWDLRQGRNVPEYDAGAGPSGALRSQIGALDAMLGGGLTWGSSCVVLGVSGSGKSSVAATYAVSAAADGHRAAIYTFDERRETLRDRMAGLGMDLDRPDLRDTLAVHELSASLTTTGRFTDRVRTDVSEGVRVVVIDSLTGFTHACPGAARAESQLHDLLAYLSERGVVTFLTVPQHGLIGTEAASQVDISYIADTVLLLRHFEAEGQLRKAITIVKRRHGDHDKGVRELLISDDGIAVGDRITEYQGVLTGVPAIGGE